MGSHFLSEPQLPHRYHGCSSGNVNWAVMGVFIFTLSAVWGIILDTVPAQLWHREQRAGIMKGAGVRNTKGLGTPKESVGCFLRRMGQPSRLGARSSCGLREAAGSEGLNRPLSHPLPQQPALCKNSKLPIKPPSLFSFHSPAHLSLLFSPFLSKLIINRSRQK